MPLVIPRRHGLDLRGAPPQQHGVAADVLALHVPRGLEEVVSVAKAHESVPLALRRPLVPDHPRFLHARPARERLLKHLVRHLACQVAHEEPEVGGVPLEETGVRPLRASA